ncbi:MAG: HNH endonuclease [Anaerolineae bacterium]|jgi:hypothetical protein|nr:HNH endonuclease [Anaerolineae bacterium]
MLEFFTKEQKEAIFANDDYCCTMCGCGIQEGAELRVEPIKMKNEDGEIEVVGGITLCELHTFVGEEGKETILEMFARLHEQAKEADDERKQSFFTEILEVYEKHNMNEDIMLWGK